VDGVRQPARSGRHPSKTAQFLVSAVACIRAVHLHADLLRGVGRPRRQRSSLGGHEAPPAIISVTSAISFPGKLFEAGEKGSGGRRQAWRYEDHRGRYGCPLAQARTDRNRDQFRLLSPATRFGVFFPAPSARLVDCRTLVVLNTIVAESCDFTLPCGLRRKPPRRSEELAAAVQKSGRRLLQSFTRPSATDGGRLHGQCTPSREARSDRT